MRKASNAGKHAPAKLPCLQLSQKPFGFCCDEQAQDPEKRYDLRNPPFASSLTDVILDSGGPGVKFRVEDIGRPPYPIQRRTLVVKDMAYLGRCRRCRGPLRWYLEDEIALARELLAKQRQDNYNESVKRNLKMVRQKARERRSRIKRKTLQNVTPEFEIHTEQLEK